MENSKACFEWKNTVYRMEIAKILEIRINNNFYAPLTLRNFSRLIFSFCPQFLSDRAKKIIVENFQKILESRKTIFRKNHQSIKKSIFRTKNLVCFKISISIYLLYAILLFYNRSKKLFDLIFHISLSTLPFLNFISSFFATKIKINERKTAYILYYLMFRFAISLLYFASFLNNHHFQLNLTFIFSFSVCERTLLIFAVP